MGTDEFARLTRNWTSGGSSLCRTRLPHLRSRNALADALLAAPRFVARLQAHFMSKSLAHRLAEYACSLSYEDLAPAAAHEGKRRVIDSLGCALGAWRDEPCAIARKVATHVSSQT